jgi:hypothetical protein
MEESMSLHFKLQIVRVRCLNEQAMEWGQDELRLFGFGISRQGQVSATGYRVLGSYSTGDVKSDGIFPMTLFETILPDNGLEFLIYLWLIEEDGGGVRSAAAALETRFRDSYREQAARLLEIRFPRNCIPFTAFYRSILGFQDDLDDAASDGRDDDVFAPYDLILDRDGIGTPVGLGHAGDVGGLSSVREIVMERSKRLGHYQVTMRYSYRLDPMVLA